MNGDVPQPRKISYEDFLIQLDALITLKDADSLLDLLRNVKLSKKNRDSVELALCTLGTIESSHVAPEFEARYAEASELQQAKVIGTVCAHAQKIAGLAEREDPSPVIITQFFANYIASFSPQLQEKIWDALAEPERLGYVIRMLALNRSSNDATLQSLQTKMFEAVERAVKSKPGVHWLKTTGVDSIFEEQEGEVPGVARAIGSITVGSLGSTLMELFAMREDLLVPELSIPRINAFGEVLIELGKMQRNNLAELEKAQEKLDGLKQKLAQCKPGERRDLEEDLEMAEKGVQLESEYGDYYRFLVKVTIDRMGLEEFMSVKDAPKKPKVNVSLGAHRQFKTRDGGEDDIDRAGTMEVAHPKIIAMKYILSEEKELSEIGPGKATIAAPKNTHQVMKSLLDPKKQPQ